MSTIIWLEVTQDKYELPVRFSESRSDLAQMAGVKPDSVSSSVSRYRNGKLHRTRFYKVIIEEDDE